VRAVGLGLLLAGCLVLLWPWYGYLLHPFAFARGDTQLYGGAGLMAGIVALIIAQARAG